jgi:hypothetical protein
MRRGKEARRAACGREAKGGGKKSNKIREERNMSHQQQLNVAAFVIA